MQKILPHLWFDKEAKEAAELYVSVFGDSKITNVTALTDTPSGDTDIVSFTIRGFEFMAISAGPLFKINPSISFMVNYDPSRDSEAKEHLDQAWSTLLEGGKVLMPLQEYPFSKHYGWVQDKYGVSWQLILTDPDGEERPFIIPSFLFVGDVCGKTDEAIDFYVQTFKNSKRGMTARYPAGSEPDKEGTVMFADFQLEGVWLAAMDSAQNHEFAFNEAVSIMVRCDSQEEMDRLSDALSVVPEAEQCGWLKDKYGVSWQITPTRMEEMMQNATPEQMERVTKAFLQMKRFNLAELERAYNGD